MTASDGTGLSVTVDGVGPPVVFLHGLACTREMWSPVSKHLVLDRQVVTVDLRGHGRSVPSRTFELTRQAEDIAEILSQLDLRDVTLVGHSAGGYAALEFAVRFPRVVDERVALLVTVGTAGSLVHLRERFVLRFSATRLFYLLLGIPPVGRLLIRVGAFGSDPNTSWIESTRRMALACPRVTKKAWVRAIAGTSLEERLCDLGVPLLATTGGRDTTVTPARIAQLARSARDGAPITIDGAGHMVPVERPAEFAGVIRRARH